MKKELDKTFLQSYGAEDFGQFLSDCIVFLEETNNDYKKLVDEKKKILMESPNIQKNIEDEYGIKLNEIEAKNLYKFMQTYRDMTEYEEREMFLRGFKEAFYFFNRLDLLKNSND